MGPNKIGNVLAKVGLWVGFPSCDGPTRDGRFNSDGRSDLKEEECRSFFIFEIFDLNLPSHFIDGRSPVTVQHEKKQTRTLIVVHERELHFLSHGGC